MKVKAAVAFAAGQPLEIEMVDLEGPKAGEVLVELKAPGVLDRRINIDDLITHTMPLERINEAFDLMHAGTSIRSVVLY